MVRGGTVTGKGGLHSFCRSSDQDLPYEVSSFYFVGHMARTGGSNVLLLWSNVQLEEDQYASSLI